MKDTKELAKEIETYIKELSHSIMCDDLKIKVSFNDKNCTVHISKMYEGLGDMISFKTLSWLSAQLGTDEINLENDHYRFGCDSCDWGSEHSVDIKCNNIKI